MPLLAPPDPVAPLGLVTFWLEPRRPGPGGRDSQVLHLQEYLGSVCNCHFHTNPQDCAHSVSLTTGIPLRVCPYGSASFRYLLLFLLCLRKSFQTVSSTLRTTQFPAHRQASYSAASERKTQPSTDLTSKEHIAWAYIHSNVLHYGAFFDSPNGACRHAQSIQYGKGS